MRNRLLRIIFLTKKGRDQIKKQSTTLELNRKYE